MERKPGISGISRCVALTHPYYYHSALQHSSDFPPNQAKR